MKLIPFNCFNRETNDELIFHINPDVVVSVAGDVLPGEIVSLPAGEPVPVEAAVIVLLNGQVLTIKNTVENVITKLGGATYLEAK